jgi:hypothetical protein
MAVQKSSALKTISFNPYAAGSKIYSQVSSAPTIGPVDKAGYAERDRAIKARKNAVLAKMKAMSIGAYANPAALRSVN